MILSSVWGEIVGPFFATWSALLLEITPNAWRLWNDPNKGTVLPNISLLQRIKTTAERSTSFMPSTNSLREGETNSMTKWLKRNDFMLSKSDLAKCFLKIKEIKGI